MARFETVGRCRRLEILRGDMTGLLDFLPHFRTRNGVVAYARCVSSHRGRWIPARSRIERWCQSDREWHRGGARTAPGGRKARPLQNEMPVRLSAGRNVVLVKVMNYAANWQLYLSIDDQIASLSLCRGETVFPDEGSTIVCQPCASVRCAYVRGWLRKRYSVTVWRGDFAGRYTTEGQSLDPEHVDCPFVLIAEIVTRLGFSAAI